MVERSWEGLEQRILEAVAELEHPDRSVRLADVAKHTALSLEQVKIGVSRLLPSDLLDGKEHRGDKRLLDVRGLRLLPRGRQVVHQWPSSDPAEAFLQLLAERIAEEPDPEGTEPARRSPGLSRPGRQGRSDGSHHRARPAGDRAGVRWSSPPW